MLVIRISNVNGIWVDIYVIGVIDTLHVVIWIYITVVACIYLNKEKKDLLTFGV